jgi:hypothetical protein
MNFVQAKLVVRDWQANRLSNPELATKHLARTERPFFKHGANCSRKVIRQGPAGPGIGVDRPGFQPCEHEETNHRSLFHINPKRIYIRLESGGRRTRQIGKGRRGISKEIRGMGTCYIYLLFTR